MANFPDIIHQNLPEWPTQKLFTKHIFIFLKDSWTQFVQQGNCKTMKKVPQLQKGLTVTGTVGDFASLTAEANYGLKPCLSMGGGGGGGAASGPLLLQDYVQLP